MVLARRGYWAIGRSLRSINKLLESLVTWLHISVVVFTGKAWVEGYLSVRGLATVVGSEPGGRDAAAVAVRSNLVVVPPPP